MEDKISPGAVRVDLIRASLNARRELAQKAVVELFLSLLPGVYRVLKAAEASQVIALALEANRGPPQAPACQPVHTGDTAGVVAPDRPGAEHLHACAVDIVQAGTADNMGRLIKMRLVTAAGGAVSVPEPLGGGDCLLAAVAAAPPCRASADILRGFQYGEFSKPLPGQVKLFT